MAMVVMAMVVMVSVYGMHMQRVQMRMSMMVLQMWMQMPVVLLVHLKTDAGYFDADFAEAWGWATVYADELLGT
jgi:hypothetical protein